MKYNIRGENTEITSSIRKYIEEKIGKLGRIKWFNNEKGYGFIELENSEDIFVHYSAIKQDGYKTLSEGQIVEYELIKTEKGLQAINVKEVSNATVC